MQFMPVVSLSELPNEILSYFYKCVAGACLVDTWDTQYFVAFETDLLMDSDEYTPEESEAYYETRRFLLATMPRGQERPKQVLVSMFN